MRRARVLIAGLAMALVGVVGALAVAEAALRIRGFQYQPFPAVQFGWPEPQVILDDFRPDPDLLWVNRDYADRLEAARRMRGGVLFLGDSCVEFSKYPTLALQRLAARGQSLAGTKLSVPGWSTEQGRAQMRRDLLDLRPRAVVVEFGWNDHWDALGPPDAETHPSRLAMWAGTHVRLFEAFAKTRDGLERRWHPEGPRRVSVERYRANLAAMADLATRMHASLIMVTAPSNHRIGAEPRYLQARHLRRLDALVPTHQQYVQSTRETAARSGAVLCDAAAAADRVGAARSSLFRHDGIHFSAAGDAFMADLVAGCIEEALRRR